MNWLYSLLTDQEWSIVGSIGTCASAFLSLVIAFLLMWQNKKISSRQNELQKDGQFKDAISYEMNRRIALFEKRIEIYSFLWHYETWIKKNIRNINIGMSCDSLYNSFIQHDSPPRRAIALNNEDILRQGFNFVNKMRFIYSPSVADVCSNWITSFVVLLRPGETVTEDKINTFKKWNELIYPALEQMGKETAVTHEECYQYVSGLEQSVGSFHLKTATATSPNDIRDSVPTNMLMEERQRYLHTVNNYDKTDADEQEKMDKIILTCSIGIIGVAFGFLGLIFDKPRVSIELFFVAVALSVGAIVCSFFASWFSVEDVKVCRPILDQNYSRLRDGETSIFEAHIVSRYYKWVEKLNLWSIILLLFGLLSFMLFLMFNLTQPTLQAKGENMGDKQQNTQPIQCRIANAKSKSIPPVSSTNLAIKQVDAPSKANTIPLQGSKEGDKK